MENQQGESTEPNPDLPHVMQELDNEDDAYLDEKISVHLFLEDLKECSKANRPLIIKAKKTISDIVFLMKQMKEKMLGLGNTFDQLSNSYKEIEKTKRPEILEITPLHSRIFYDLKMSFSRWSNVFEHEQRHLDKLFEPVFKLLKLTNKQNIENLNVRGNMVKKLILTLDKAKQGKDLIENKKEMMFGTKELVCANILLF